MHLLINCEPAAVKGLKAFEEAICSGGRNPYSFHSDESGSIRLARTAASAFTMRGSQAAGVPVMFNAYLEERGEKNHLVTFHGHRMNIGFYNCAAVYLHHADIADFLQSYGDKNKLLKSVDFDCNEKLYLAGCRYE